MQKARRRLDTADRRITAVLMASPRASWRSVAAVLGVSERTVVRRAAPLYQDRTLRATAVRNPALFPHLVPTVLRIRCRPARITAIAAALARRSDTVWVDILGGGDEICIVAFIEGPDARNNLLLRDLPVTAAVQSWTAYDLLKVFPAGFAWSAGLLSEEESQVLWPDLTRPPEVLSPLPEDKPLIDALVEDARMTYGELAHRTGRTPRAVQRRLHALVEAHVVRLATEVDLALLGVHAEALLWIMGRGGAGPQSASSSTFHGGYNGLQQSAGGGGRQRSQRVVHLPDRHGRGVDRCLRNRGDPHPHRSQAHRPCAPRRGDSVTMPQAGVDPIVIRTGHGS
jgi:DNA-binding Lrp family transcriptional regulator